MSRNKAISQYLDGVAELISNDDEMLQGKLGSQADEFVFGVINDLRDYIKTEDTKTEDIKTMLQQIVDNEEVQLVQDEEGNWIPSC